MKPCNHEIMDYYQILSISKDASPEEIKKAFWKLAQKYHPDKPGGDAQKFKEINEAYQVLSDSQKRAQYDQFGTTFEQAQAQGGFTGFEGFRDFASYADAMREAKEGGFRDFFGRDLGDLGDIFEDFFSSAGFGGEGFRPQRKRTYYRQGQNIEIDLEIDFKEAVFGAKRDVEIKKDIICSRCQGKGIEPGSKMITCQNCQGAGRISQIRSVFFAQIRQIITCPNCRGQGRVPEKKCSQCHGSGIIKEKKKIEIKIPAGIDNNGVIRLSGQGNAGKYGAPAGHLFIGVKVKPHSQFERQGYNILSQKEISISQAALGAKIEIETVDEPVILKIPPGTQSGQIFKLKDKGVSYLRGQGRGDHLVEAIVRIPKKLSKRQKELLEELDKLGE